MWWNDYWLTFVPLAMIFFVAICFGMMFLMRRFGLMHCSSLMHLCGVGTVGWEKRGVRSGAAEPARMKGCLFRSQHAPTVAQEPVRTNCVCASQTPETLAFSIAARPRVCLSEV